MRRYNTRNTHTNCTLQLLLADRNKKKILKRYKTSKGQGRGRMAVVVVGVNTLTLTCTHARARAQHGLEVKGVTTQSATTDSSFLEPAIVLFVGVVVVIVVIVVVVGGLFLTLAGCSLKSGCIRYLLLWVSK